MKQGLAAAVVILACVPLACASAGSKVVIGGVDTRIPQLQVEQLSQDLARDIARQAKESAARAAALTITAQDLKDAESRGADWAEYFKRWCGENNPGCATTPAPVVDPAVDP